jgi:DNA-binding XRE family transcriptional regulator
MENNFKNTKEMQELIAKGKRQGIISYQEIMDTIENIDLSSAQIDKLYEALASNGIEIVPDDFIITKEERDKMRKEFIKNNQKEWKNLGRVFKKKREKLGLTKTETAINVGTNRTTLRNFEEGKPIHNARLIQKSYENYLTLYEIQHIPI